VSDRAPEPGTAPAEEPRPQPAPRPGGNGVILEVADIHTYYGSIHALKGITLDVREGEIVTLIGANGAGKSTTLRSINGLNHPRRGSIRFQGRDITNEAPHKIVNMGVAQSPEGRKLFSRMSVLENLEMGAFQRTDRPGIREDLDRVYGLFPRLNERKTQKAGTLSGGEQQMVAMGRALMARPKLLMLDEPSMGLAPIFVERIFDIVREINKQGTPILLVEQNALMALDVANRGYVMETGHIALTDDANVLAKNEQVRKAYLGEE
jgi:branched-chain amino acid transport system ATP-binding protein